jgi:hypothetical protein
MNEEAKKVEPKVEQPEQLAKAAELPEKDLENIAGGTSNLNLSKSN